MVLSASQVYALLEQTGFPDDKLVTMTAIALAESGGNSLGHNGKVFRRGDPIPPSLWQYMGKVCAHDYCGDSSYGLFQINMRPDLYKERMAWFGLTNPDQLYDPATNARAALKIYQQQGLNAWTTYTHGKYQTYLADAAQARLNNEAPAPTDAIQPVPDPWNGWGGSSDTPPIDSEDTRLASSGGEVAVLIGLGFLTLVLLLSR